MCSSSEVGAAEVKYAELLKEITEVVGPPKNYGLSAEDQKEVDKRKEEEQRQKLAAEAAEKKRRNEATLAEIATQYSRWVSCGEEERHCHSMGGISLLFVTARGHKEALAASPQHYVADNGFTSCYFTMTEKFLRGQLTVSDHFTASLAGELG